jgi:hypothetical protein
MKLRTLFVGAVVVAAALAGTPAARGSDRLRHIVLEEVLSIGGLNEETLFQWTGVAADDEGFIYVLDAMDYSLKKFDVRGKLLKKTGGKGQGPGEFMAPRLLDGSGDSLYATDQNAAAIFVFDRNLEFKRMIPCPSLIEHLKALGDGRVAVSVLGFQEPGRILILNGEGKLLSELAYADKGSGPLMDSISFVPDGRGHFYLAYLFQDRVEKWTVEGKRLWGVKLLGGKKTGTKKIASFVLPGETCLKGIALDGRGHVFVLGGRLAKNPSRDVFVLSQDGELLTTFTLPDTSHCLYIDRAHFLYARGDDGITLKKYRIVYE